MITETQQRIIFRHYGAENQLDQLIEECAELITAISKFKRNKSWLDRIDLSYNITEEMSDVMNLIEQFKLADQNMFDLIEKIKADKVARQINRIGKE